MGGMHPQRHLGHRQGEAGAQREGKIHALCVDSIMMPLYVHAWQHTVPHGVGLGIQDRDGFGARAARARGTHGADDRRRCHSEVAVQLAASVVGERCVVGKPAPGLRKFQHSRVHVADGTNGVHDSHTAHFVDSSGDAALLHAACM